MLDMGGAPSAASDKSKARINANKNLQVQVICFDFDVLTNAVASDKPPTKLPQAPDETTSATRLTNQQVQPHASVVQQMADLLKVDLGGLSAGGKHANNAGEDDDLSLLTGQKEPAQESQQMADHNPFDGIHTKYAAKLAKKGLTGGIVERTKEHVEDAMKRGDAAGHFA
jgi:pyruvate/2-oxoglutarate dehydrogenase complex dihydrolipoamide acyltransferase (E2) component